MTAQVDELLKTCRFYHRMLVAVCVAALLFGIAPSDTLRLQQAIEEAEQVSEMSFARLLNQAIRANDEARTYMDDITVIMSGAGAGYEGEAYEALFSRRFTLPHRNATIEQLEKYILARQSVVFNIPQIDKSVLADIKQNLANLSHPERLKLLEYRMGGKRTGVSLRWKGGVRTQFEIDYLVSLKQTRLHTAPLERCS